MGKNNLIKFVVILFCLYQNFTSLIGLFLGYFLAKVFSGKEAGKRGKIKSLILKFENFYFHFHHWLLGTFILIFNFFLHFLPLEPISIGVVGGIIVQGLEYPDWHRILIRISSTESN